MSNSITSVDKNIATLIEVTEAILRGEFDIEAVTIDAEGVMQELAKKINTMLLNMKNVEVSLLNAGAQAPTLVVDAINVVDLMKKTAGEVLDTSDRLSDRAESLESKFAALEGLSAQDKTAMQEDIDSIKNDIFDIIATQTFQDVARQKMEAMIDDMNQLRDWLLNCLVVLNIKKDNSPENVHKKTELLRDVKGHSVEDKDKQDLVDDLLAEFGF
jgi:chemotaxis protein CheZ